MDPRTFPDPKTTTALIADPVHVESLTSVLNLLLLKPDLGSDLSPSLVFVLKYDKECP